jgi:hypothetical protein
MVQHHQMIQTKMMVLEIPLWTLVIQTRKMKIAVEMMMTIAAMEEIAQTLVTAIVEILAIHLIHRMIAETVETLEIQVTVVMAVTTVAEMEETMMVVIVEEETLKNSDIILLTYH